MNIHPVVYEKRIKEAEKLLERTLKPQTPRERALIIQIEEARKALRG